MLLGIEAPPLTGQPAVARQAVDPAIYRRRDCLIFGLAIGAVAGIAIPLSRLDNHTIARP